MYIWKWKLNWSSFICRYFIWSFIAFRLNNLSVRHAGKDNFNLLLNELTTGSMIAWINMFFFCLHFRNVESWNNGIWSEVVGVTHQEREETLNLP